MKKLSKSEQFFKTRRDSSFAIQERALFQLDDNDDQTAASAELDKIVGKKIEEYSKLIFPRAVAIYVKLKSEKGKEIFSQIAMAEITKFNEDKEEVQKHNKKGKEYQYSFASRCMESETMFESIYGMLLAFSEGKTFEDFIKMFDSTWIKSKAKDSVYDYFVDRFFKIWQEEETLLKQTQSGVTQ